jgi:enoyl-CoA hydratase/carnithine racemase
MSEILSCQKSGALWLTLNRADALNALTNSMLDVLLTELQRAVSDTNVRAIVFTGAGSKAFCSGIDLTQRQTLSTEEKGDQSRRVLELVKCVCRFPKPTIAAIGGWCLGAGLELALACDLRIGAEDSRFGFPEMTLGAYPGGGGAVLLPRLIGRAKALELLLSARRLDAMQALQLGLISEVVSRTALDDAASQAANGIAALAPLAVAALKKSIDGGLDLSLDEAFTADQLMRRPLDATNDYQEGLKAHKQKRTPVFTGT